MSSPFIDENQTIIAVMGTTGVGKSTFINYATNGGASIGENLTASYRIPETDVWLIDTPGFDDTYRSDAKILEEINQCLTEYFHKNARVTGVLYVHAITEARMRGSAMKNLRMFRQVVGDKNMKHCCLVTTKWSRQQEALSQSREVELRTNETFWKPLLERGASMMQFQDSMHSAMDIIRPFTRCKRFMMKLMHEYNVEGKDLDKTDAGREVYDDLEAAKKEHEEEMEALREEWKQASDEKDEKMKEMITAERNRLEKEMTIMKEGQELLHKKLSDEKQALAAKLEQDRLIRLNDKQATKNRAWRWVARVGAGTVAAGAIVLSGGLATPAAVLFYGGVEGTLQDMKEREG